MAISEEYINKELRKLMAILEEHPNFIDNIDIHKPVRHDLPSVSHLFISVAINNGNSMEVSMRVAKWIYSMFRLNLSGDFETELKKSERIMTNCDCKIEGKKEIDNMNSFFKVANKIAAQNIIRLITIYFIKLMEYEDYNKYLWYLSNGMD